MNDAYDSYEPQDDLERIHLIVLVSAQLTEEQKRVLYWAIRKCREIEAENARAIGYLGVDEL